jgi:hypothetical protein
MLHCLHSFCEECLDKKLVGEGGDAGTTEASIDCPTCGHQTKVMFNCLHSSINLCVEFSEKNFDYKNIIKTTTYFLSSSVT